MIWGYWGWLRSFLRNSDLWYRLNLFRWAIDKDLSVFICFLEIIWQVIKNFVCINVLITLSQTTSNLNCLPPMIWCSSVASTTKSSNSVKTSHFLLDFSIFKMYSVKKFNLAGMSSEIVLMSASETVLGLWYQAYHAFNVSETSSLKKIILIKLNFFALKLKIPI